MDKQTLTDYVASERERGVRDADIRSELLSKGWAELMVTEVLDVPLSSAVVPFPTITELVKRSLDELWRNIWKAFLIMVLPVVLVGLVGVAGGVSMAFMHSQPLMIGVGGLVLAAILLMCVVMFISTIMIIKEIANGWSLSYGTAFTDSLPYVFPLLWVAILTTLAVIGGLTLFIVPGFLASIWYAFAQISAVVDGRRGADALLYSKQLVRGHLMTVFVYYLVVVLLVMVANFLLGFIPIIGSFVSLLATPFMLIFSVHFYKALQQTKKGEEVQLESHHFTTSLIILGIVAITGLIWLMFHFSLT